MPSWKSVVGGGWFCVWTLNWPLVIKTVNIMFVLTCAHLSSRVLARSPIIISTRVFSLVSKLCFMNESTARDLKRTKRNQLLCLLVFFFKLSESSIDWSSPLPSPAGLHVSFSTSLVPAAGNVSNKASSRPRNALCVERGDGCLYSTSLCLEPF